MTPQEIREKIIEVVLENGGHLASSLGAVEIAVALSEVFDPQRDRVVWDVGHQAYAWKLLTDRGGKTFESLRKLDGMAPFPNPAESGADAAVAGHAGVALSVAAGLAAARDRKGGDERVVAVIGDASIVNGTSFEALNNLAAATSRVTVVLNDNESRVKSRFLGNAFFEQFGLRYMGPVDGHDLAALVAAFTVARDDKRSVLVHVVTRKGKGYQPAEDDPTAYHGVADGALSRPTATKKEGWSEVFARALSELARRDARIVALTAGMRVGTGLSPFAAEFPGRFFDVGISEGHMVSFAAGLAAGGMRPVVAVYSSFLQRAVDQVMHDVCISNLPVVFCVDRAGVVGQDGATHQGVFDVAMLRCLPNLVIAQPCDEAEMNRLLAEALERMGPTLVRYPRGTPPPPMGVSSDGLAVAVARPEAQVQIWATGDMLRRALDVASRIGAGVVYARYIKPFDAEMLARQRAAGCRIVSLENGSVAGGFGEAIGADLRFGWPDRFIPHGKVEELELRFGLDPDSIAEAING